MTAARRLGLDAAVTAYTGFDGELAVVVTRYHCILGADGRVQRVHQEDMCQALAVFPRDKYEFDCGPRAARLVATLEPPSLPETRSDNADGFIAALVYNYLIGAPDAHAKNYSVLLAGDQVKFAPLYDVASGLPFDRRGHEGLGSAAMSIGGEKRFGKVVRRYGEQFGAEVGREPERLLARVREMAERIPDTLAEFMYEPEIVGPAGELRPRLLDRVADLCSTTCVQLDGGPASRRSSPVRCPRGAVRADARSRARRGARQPESPS